MNRREISKLYRQKRRFDRIEVRFYQNIKKNSAKVLYQCYRPVMMWQLHHQKAGNPLSRYCRPKAEEQLNSVFRWHSRRAFKITRLKFQHCIPFIV